MINILKKPKWLVGALLCLFISGQNLVSAPVHAVTSGDWRAGHVIDDSLFYNKNSMSVDQIQLFLSSKVPTCDSWGTKPYGSTTRRAYAESQGVTMPFICLKDYQENPSTHENNLNGNPVPAGAQSAATIIWNAAQQYNISPQVILVQLQKENILVTDDWPMPSQYKTAAGYGCPDTAACDSQYFGFYNQVTNMTHQLRLYTDNSNQYNYVPGPGNNILYNPNRDCGSSSVTIENQATASLYDYTPYQPNQAALNNLYGSGDSCSAHGIRNFWTTFNDWFGASWGIDPQLVGAVGNPTQYVLYGNTLYPIPSVEVKLAWGLDKLSLVPLSSGYISSLPVKSPLTRVLKPDNTGTVFLADNGLKYGFSSQPLMATWGYSSSDISNVPAAMGNMLPTSNPLGFVMQSSPNGAPGMYLVDGNTIHLMDTPDTMTAWQGDTNVAIVPSNALFSHYTNGSVVATFKAQNTSGQNYIVNAGLKLPADAATFSVFPGAPVVVGDTLLNSLTNGQNATPIVRTQTGSTVYLVDTGQKHGFIAPAYLLGYSNNGQIATTVLTQGHINMLPQGVAINNLMVTNPSSSATYMLNGSKRQIPANLLPGYLGGGQKPLTISDSMLSLINTGPPITRFIQGAGLPGVNVIMDNGKYRTFPTPQDFTLWGGDASQITYVSQEALSQFPFGGALGSYVSDGTNNYVFGQPGVLYTVDAPTAANWGLTSPVQLNPSTLTGFGSGGALPSSFTTGTKTYMMRKGVGYASTDSNMLTVWGLSSGLPSLHSVVNKLFTERPLTKYVTSSDVGDGKIYVVSENNFLYLTSPTTMLNQGYSNDTIVDVKAADIISRGTSVWNNSIVRDVGGGYWAIDAGTKRQIQLSAINQWTNNQTLSVQTVSSAFLGLLPTMLPIGKSISTNDGDTKIYAVINGQRQWITSYDNYTQQYAPTTTVAPTLRDSLPTGPSL
ncbi:MAG TPA: hypothetical protein VNX65_04665 [Patescibacteria group bacterium]|jgi:hypothetical protein|nr:hypothetical protein [Patescibacteria group bacterium]